jgi:hypothetical protein
VRDTCAVSYTHTHFPPSIRFYTPCARQHIGDARFHKLVHLSTFILAVGMCSVGHHLYQRSKWTTSLDLLHAVCAHRLREGPSIRGCNSTDYIGVNDVDPTAQSSSWSYKH